MFGLLEKNIIEIKEILSMYKEIEDVLVFGSRAIGNYKATSDVDIVLKGANIVHDTIISVSEKLNEESSMPYHFDVVNFNSIKNSALIEHIEKKGISF